MKKIVLLSKHIIYPLKLAGFWLIYFAIFRITFIVYHHDKLPDKNLSEALIALIAGYRLDLSVISYFVLLSSLLWSIQQYTKKRIIHLLNHIYNSTLIILTSILSIANIRIYEEWGTLLNHRAFIYLLYPKEVLAFTSIGALVLILICWIAFSSIGILLYKKIAVNFSYSSDKRILKSGIIAMFFPCLFLGMRGGIQQIPINESAAYYSVFPIDNHIATNNIWYLMHSFLNANISVNPYQYGKQDEARRRVENLFSCEKDSTEKILNVDRPNIVFIILESWTSDIIKALGGENNVTPNFDLLTKNGLLFTNIYSSGFRTDQGLVSVLSGFPAQPNNSIITLPSKAEKLKSINHYFTREGYHSSFYYGGEIGFANMKTYLLNSGFEKIIDKNNFNEKQMNSKWGAHDEYVFSRQLEDLKQMKEPFFSVLLTLSTHEPFEVPMETTFKGDDKSDKFRKAAYYTDKCIGDYFKAAKKEKWFSNTLFILVADHGHHLPKENDMNMPPSRKIPLLFYGEPLKVQYRGKKENKIAGQQDIPVTLMTQIISGKRWQNDFTWSKNILEPSAKQFAYYSNENVLGWVSSKGDIVYSFALNKIINETNAMDEISKDSILIDAKVFLQTLYQQYLDY